ncbi:MAG: hypothetical protein AAGF07_00485 [Patescibacteria group bacterium]
MFWFAEFVEFSLFRVFLAEENNEDVLTTLINSRLKFIRLIPVSIADLRQALLEGEGLFEKESSKSYIVDTKNLNLDPKAINYLSELNNDFPEHKLYFFSSSQQSFTADLKRKWQNSGFDYISLKKPDTVLMYKLAKKYIAKLGLQLEDKQLDLILKQSQHYSEIIDNLDFISLADDKVLALKSLLKQDSLPIFMIGFDPLKLDQQINKWYQQIGENEVQLALSLIFSKLNKSSNEIAQSLIRKLILIDQKMKTQSKVEILTWYKLFLWQALEKVSK